MFGRLFILQLIFNRIALSFKNATNSNASLNLFKSINTVKTITR